MKKQTLILFFFLYIIGRAVSETATSPMQLSYNKKYFSAGVAQVDLSETTSKTVWNPKDFNISYPFAFTDTVAGIFLSFNNLITDHTSTEISFNGKVDTFDQSSMVLRVYCNFLSNRIKVLNYRYTVYTSKYINDYNWKWLVVGLKIERQLSTKYDFQVEMSTPLNIQGGVTALFSFTGFDYQYKGDIYSSSSQQFANPKITLILNQIFTTGSSTTTLPITLDLRNQIIYLRNLYFSMMVYNTEFYKDNEEISIETINVSFKYYRNDIISNSIVFGFNGYELNILSKVEFSFNIEFKDQQYFTSSFAYAVSHGVFHYFTISRIQTYYCSYNTPYYHKESNFCYAVCPSSTRTNQDKLTCDSSISSSLSKMQSKQGIMIIVLVVFLFAAVAVYCFRFKKSKLNNNQMIELSGQKPPTDYSECSPGSRADL